MGRLTSQPALICCLAVLVLALVVLAGCGGGHSASSSSGSTGPANTGVTSNIATSGGTVSLANTASVTFPAGAFPSDRQVSLTAGSDDATTNTFSDTTAIFGHLNKLGYDVHVNIGNSQIATQNYMATLSVPDAFASAVPAGSHVQVFAQVYEAGGQEVLDNFELIPSTYDPAKKTVTVPLDWWTFTNTRSSDKSYEAVLTLAAVHGSGTMAASIRSTPGPRDSGGCQASMISCPIPGGCTISGNPPRGFNPNPTLNPVTGNSTPHKGVDLVSPQDGKVMAAQDGVVEIVKLQQNQQHPAPIGYGYGEYVVIRGTDGSATLYGHLEPGTPLPVGTQVTAGEVVAHSGGTAGTPGAGGSTGPHLHFEYVPSGNIVQSPNRIDPFPCLTNSSNPPGNTATGTLIGTFTGTRSGNGHPDYPVNGKISCTFEYGQFSSGNGFGQVSFDSVSCTITGFGPTTVVAKVVINSTGSLLLEGGIGLLGQDDHGEFGAEAIIPQQPSFTGAVSVTGTWSGTEPGGNLERGSGTWSGTITYQVIPPK